MKKLLIVLILNIIFSINAYAIEPKIDKILVLKSERKMFLISNGENIKEYKIALGFEPIGHKVKQGDGKTPEGNYTISWRNPQSSYTLSLGVSYPNAKDKEVAKKLGVSPGGDIMIHGLPNKMKYIGKAHTLNDWTFGCIAVTSEEIKEIWDIVPNGTKIEIKP